jgi:hypothetical protein
MPERFGHCAPGSVGLYRFRRLGHVFTWFDQEGSVINLKDGTEVECPVKHPPRANE